MVEDGHGLVVVREEEMIDDVGSPLYLLAANVLQVPGRKEDAQPGIVWLQLLLVLEVLLDSLPESLRAGPWQGMAPRVAQLVDAKLGHQQQASAEIYRCVYRRDALFFHRVFEPASEESLDIAPCCIAEQYLLGDVDEVLVRFHAYEMAAVLGKDPASCRVVVKVGGHAQAGGLGTRRGISP